VPSLVLNYGLIKNLELVGELRIQRSPAHTVNVADPGLFVKAVPLLPSTVPGERHFGFEGLGIVSGRLLPFTYHVNLGGGIQRAGGEPVAI